MKSSCTWVAAIEHHTCVKSWSVFHSLFFTFLFSFWKSRKKDAAPFHLSKSHNAVRKSGSSQWQPQFFEGGGGFGEQHVHIAAYRGEHVFEVWREPGAVKWNLSVLMFYKTPCLHGGSAGSLWECVVLHHIRTCTYYLSWETELRASRKNN